MNSEFNESISSSFNQMEMQIGTDAYEANCHMIRATAEANEAHATKSLAKARLYTAQADRATAQKGIIGALGGVAVLVALAVAVPVIVYVWKWVF